VLATSLIGTMTFSGIPDLWNLQNATGPSESERNRCSRTPDSKKRSFIGNTRSTNNCNLYGFRLIRKCYQRVGSAMKRRISRHVRTA
jgi:hypothetical protein